MDRLNPTLLPALVNVAVPRYDRAAVAPGIVHVGVGGFHRAHEAVYLDDLMGQGMTDWAIAGVGLRPADRAMRDALAPQDGLYTVVTRDQGGDEARVIGSLTRYLFAPEQASEVRDVLALPATRIVSMTITEGGYADTEDNPEDVFALLADALDRRRQAGVAPFTVLSCDNLPHNGDVARRALLAAAGRRVPDLSAWIEANVACPNGMVDRITPQTTDADRLMVRERFGLDDAWPVVCEPFRQWIIEDKFSAGRPPLEDVGAQIVADVAPYEQMKLRLLNASHSAMAYLGFLAGFGYVHEVMADDLFIGYIRRLMDDEVTPLLAPVPGVDLVDYKATLLTRFANPAIGDQVTRICLDGSSKFPKFLLPSLGDALASGRPSRLLTLAVAGWFRYLSGEDESGRPFAVDDPQAADLQARARQGRADPRPLLARTDLFGGLAQSARFVADLSFDLEDLYSQGARVTLMGALA